MIVDSIGNDILVNFKYREQTQQFEVRNVDNKIETQRNENGLLLQ